MIELERCGSKEEWDEYLLEHDGHPLQLWGWGQVKAAHGWKAERIFAYGDEKIVGAAQILIRQLPFPFRSFAYVPRGPIVGDEHQEEFLKLLADFVKREYKSVVLSVEPHLKEFRPPSGWQHGTNSVLSAETVLLDITKSESDLLAVMAKKTRQYIRKSASEGIVIKQVRSREDLEACLAIYRDTAARAHFNLHSEQYYLDVFSMLKDHSPVFAAYLDGAPIAFLWLVISGSVAYELYGGMNDRGQELRANYALKWHAIRKTKEWGLSEYDFGGLVAGGVTTFKQGWTDEPTALVGTYDYPLSPNYVLWNKALPAAKKLSQKIKRK